MAGGHSGRAPDSTLALTLQLFGGRLPTLDSSTLLPFLVSSTALLPLLPPLPPAGGGVGASLYAYASLPASSLALCIALRTVSPIWLRRRELQASSALSLTPMSFCPETMRQTASLTSGLDSVHPSKWQSAAVHSSESYLDMRARWSETWHTSSLRKRHTDDGDVLTSMPFRLSFLMHLAMNLW